MAERARLVDGAPLGAVEEVETHLDRVAELRRRGLVLFPIRHHSPACAWHLRRLTLSLRPAAVLVEGPRDFDPLLPLLLHPRTRPPVAVYTAWTHGQRRSRRTEPPDEPVEPALPPPRFAGYYPLCDYSPELVALRAGSRVGARLRFIDLTFPEQLVAKGTQTSEASPRVVSLVEESRLRASQYTLELASRLGCRDADELWDHLFEHRFGEDDTESFVREVTTFTLLARSALHREVLELDGTATRERAMASAISEELAAVERRSSQHAEAAPVLVVCGGVHASGIVRLLSEGCKAPTLAQGVDGDHLTLLTRYSFPQLDALNGYDAGMPAPYYYQRLWDRAGDGSKDPGTDAARELLVEIARRSRQRDLPFPLSPADSIAAVEQTRRLAWLRRHPTPCRQDLVDAATSCFVKGEREGDPVLELVREVLGGSAVGEVPREAGLPPLVADFRRRCARLRLDLTRSQRRRRALDIYRKRVHRELSRFFHSLRFLGSSYAALLGGPDFRRGTGLELMQEHWEVGWSPRIEVELMEASVYGATVEEAAVHKLREVVAGLERDGRGRSAALPVELLVAACRMGLHRHLDELLRLIEAAALEDPSFLSLVAAIDQLVLLWQSREVLEAHRLAGVPRLAALCFRRACFLLPRIGNPGDDEASAIVGGLAGLRERVAAAELSESPFRPDLFFAAAVSLVEGDARWGPPAHPTIVGGAAGILFGEGRLDESGLLRLFSGHLAAAIRPPSRGGARDGRTAFLRGLLVTGREALWRLPRLLESLDEALTGWTEEEFLANLPELRLAFSNLTPREVDRVARLVTAIAGGGSSPDGDAQLPASSAAGDSTINAVITNLAGEALRRDGLEELLQ